MTTQDGTAASRIDVADMGRSCAFCKGRTFRRSRLQLKDVGSLLALQYPVRCLSCSKRQRVGLDTARRAVPSTVRQVRAPQEETPWDGSPWGSSHTGGAGLKPHFVNEGHTAVPETPVTKPIAMPDLHGVRLPHVAQMPPGDGENLA